FFQAEVGIRDATVTGVQTCALPISAMGSRLRSPTLLRRHLHPALKELGYVNPYAGTHKAGTRLVERWLSAFNTLHTNAAASVPRSEERRVGKECRVE